MKTPIKNLRYLLVKVPRGIALAVVIFTVPFFASYFYSEPVTISGKTDQYFKQQLDLTKKGLLTLRSAVAKRGAITQLRNLFYQSRLVYKKLAVLSDYFNQYETRSINGPALDRIDAGMIDRVIAPQGYQAIEELLFGQTKTVDFKKLKHLLDEMLVILGNMEKEPDRAFKFKDELVWDAMRSATVQLMTMGITGFDSPVAEYSLTESRAYLDGCKQLLGFYKNEIEKADPLAYKNLLNLLDRSIAYLRLNNDFEKFDRLFFITQYLDPFHQQLTKTRLRMGIGVPQGNNVINFESLSIFNSDALSINFSSPPKEYWITPERVNLGKLLFSDPILSGSGKRSCATCHRPDKGFADGLAKPYGIDNKQLLDRNTPTLWNAGLQTKQFYDSRTDILERQLGEVVHSVQEMEGSLLLSVDDLKRSGLYAPLFKTAYANEKETISVFTIASAISSYVRTLQSLDSRFDQYIRGDKKQLTASEKNGFNLFAGKAKCATCHFIPLFNGVVPPFYMETESEVLGVPLTKNKKPAVLDPDLGKYLFTKAEIHRHSFKTPSLRNISLTAPYMHNGVFDSLEEVMAFYNDGGGAGLKIAPPNQTLPREKLNLTKKEITDIIAFMKALTDTIPPVIR